MAADVLERVAAGLLLVVAAPIMLVVSLAILVVDGRPVFYRGTRLGRAGCPFTIYKFRSLTPDAQGALGAQLVNHAHDVETRLGGLLRETRLDELPQLINVMRGEMSLFGPRPERPEIYERLCREIPGYERRFEVKPGLVGYSQVFTPHGAPKRLRTWIDNRAMEQRPTWVHGLSLVVYTALRTVRQSIRSLVVALRDRVWRRHVLRRRPDRRRLARRRPAAARIAYRDRSGAWVRRPIVDINETALRVEPEGLRPEPSGSILVEVDGEAGRHRPRRRTARCRITPPLNGEGRRDDVIEYEPVSENSRYFIEQYVLAKSFAPIRRGGG